MNEWEAFCDWFDKQDLDVKGSVIDLLWTAWQAAWNHPRLSVTSAGEIVEDGILKGAFHG